jgi:signal transduction histidine kinase
LIVAERQETGEDPCNSDTDIAAVLRVIENALMNGTVPGETFRAIREEDRQKLEQIRSDILATRQFALALASGDLSQKLAVKGHLAGSLKSLQSNLRHLTWQAEQIASGDLTQRVHFMGDFSASFNAMVGHLSKNETDRTRREQELLEANASLAQEIANHRRSEEVLKLTNRKLNLLASITRHDIRNQLMALGTYLELHRNAGGDPAMLAAYLEKENKIVETIISQINFTKDYENLGVKEPVWNPLEAVIAEVKAALPAFGKVALGTDTAGIGVYADMLVSKVFFNLIDNALRYGGETMTAIRITAAEGNEGMVITVQDDGAGISAGDRSHLFTRGFGKNTGFGLHLSREILALTNISIVEDSEPGMGARFRIKVPAGAYRFR